MGDRYSPDTVDYYSDHNHIFAKMKKFRHYFITGLLVILPVYITVYFLFIIFRFIDSFWEKIINYYIKKHLGFAIPRAGFVLGVITILAVGVIASHFFSRRIFYPVERWFQRLPFVSQIYPAARQIVNSFMSKESRAFKKVVLVEYPSKGIWSIGFITNEGFKEANEKTGKELLHIFIATTPSP